MRIWIDLSTAPDPLFFRPIAERLRCAGHETWVTAREFGETTQIARASGFEFDAVGEHGGRSLAGKAGAILRRARDLTRLARTRRPDLAVGFNSYAQALAARAAGVPLATSMDYEYQPANHLAFRLARRVIVPRGFDERVLRRQGARARAIAWYDGLKEHVTLADFRPDTAFGARLAPLGIGEDDVLAVVRPPATSSAYHRFANRLFEEVLRELGGREGVKLMVLPRYPEQAVAYRALRLRNLVIPDTVVDGLNLVHRADLVVSAGGSMNREAVVLGTPAWTVFAGRMAGVDRALIADGRLGWIRTAADVRALPAARKPPRAYTPPDARVLEQVVAAILSVAPPAAAGTRARARAAVR